MCTSVEFHLYDLKYYLIIIIVLIKCEQVNEEKSILQIELKINK